MTQKSQDAIKDTVALFGSRAALCEALGVSNQAISNWRREGMPAKRKLQVIRLAIERNLQIPTSLLVEDDAVEAADKASRSLCLEAV